MPTRFSPKAEEALGHPVEVISGIEEARLIYLGVSHHTDTAEGGSNLVIDIGGGSTELIIGEGYEPQHLESLYDRLRRRQPARISTTASSARSASSARGSRCGSSCGPSRRRSGGAAGSRAIGSSGTVRAARDVAHELRPRR